MDIFTKTHTDRDGNSTPIVSMEAQHLCNTINLHLVKLPHRVVEEFKARAYSEYAPVEMEDRTRRTLKRKKLTAEVEQKILNDIERIEIEALDLGLNRMMPYIVVGVARDDTRDGVVKILQEATGITGRVELPVYVSAQLDDDEDEEEYLLNPGDFDYDPPF